ncbi:MAG: replicative DNA helicase [Chlamydiales bacterium]|nr:replicative DNA helicase [Chlamydiales bacterium]
MSDAKPKLKSPPSSKESEMMVLGCMLSSVNALNIAAGVLNDSDFYYNEHKLIFGVLKNAYSKDLPVDVHLVAEELKRQDLLPAVGGIGYLTTVAQYAGTSAHVEEYANLVHNKALLRRMIHAAQVVETSAMDEPENVLAALDSAQQIFYKIGQSVQSRDGTTLREILEGTKSDSKLPFLRELEQRQELYQQRGPDDPGVTGVPTHFYDLDKMLNGMGRSNLIIVAARPAMGKTAFAVNIAENVCFKSGYPVGIFSLEMSAEQLVHRIICSQAEVESDKIKKGSLSGQEYQQVYECVERIKNHMIVIDDQPGLTINELRSRARRMKEAHNIEMLVIDYLQLLSGSASKGGDNRQAEITEISRMLKNLARELNIPIICLSQLSRKVEERPGHRPIMSDLRESGAIEQDADVILFLFRREYYDPHDKPGQAECIVAKNRHGGIGSAHLAFRKEFAQFNSLSRMAGEAEESHRPVHAYEGYGEE